jgi:hypothetical protein
VNLSSISCKSRAFAYGHVRLLARDTSGRWAVISLSPQVCASLCLADPECAAIATPTASTENPAVSDWCGVYTACDSQCPVRCRRSTSLRLC